MENTNIQIEQQDLNVEMEVNDEKIAISEKSDQMMKKSITYLTVGFWSVAILMAIQLSSMLLINNNVSGIGIGSNIFATLIVGGIIAFLLIKMYAYIGDYKIFRETKTQQALEDLLDAQKGYYGWIYILPAVIIGVALIFFIFGSFLH